MNHIEFFIEQLELNSRSLFGKKMERGVMSGWMRPVAIFVVYRFNGLSVAEVANVFSIDRPGTYICLGRQEGYYQTRDEVFLDRFNKILTFYNAATRAYLKRNNIYDYD